MPKENAYQTSKNLLRLAILMNTEKGITIKEIKDKFECARSTAHRMINALEEAFSGRVELEREAPSIMVEQFEKKEVGEEGKEYTYKIYPPSTELIFNDVGIDTLASLKIAEQRLRTENLKNEADEINLLATQINDRLQIRSGFGIKAETLLEAQGVATRVAPKVQAADNILRSLQASIVDNKPIRIKYFKRSEDKHKTYRLDPLGVIFHRFPHLIAISHNARRKGAISFRADEIKEVEELKGERKITKSFNIEEFCQQSFGAYFGDETEEVEWRFDETVAHDAEKFVFHPLQKQTQNEDGSLTVEFKAKGKREMIWELFQWANKVEIVKPESLKKEYIMMVNQLDEMVRTYKA